MFVKLPVECSRFLDQERARLQSAIGKPFSTGDVIQLLIAQHKAKMRMKAEMDPNSVAWMYKHMGKTG